MKQSLSLLVGLSIAGTAYAGVISYEEQEYETVNWISSPEAGLGVNGSVGDINVGFSSAMRLPTQTLSMSSRYSPNRVKTRSFGR